MTNEKTDFWITCPDCKRKLGVSPKIVLKYVDRLFTEATDKFAKETKPFLKREQVKK